jgi:transposase
VQRDELGHRGRKGDPLYGIRRLLLRADERLSDAARTRLEAGLAAGDPDDELYVTWQAKEALRWMYAARTMAVATLRFDAFVNMAKSSSVPELHRLAKTMTKWRTEILAHHSTGASNGPTEAVNLLIKKVLRVAHGFRNLDNYRLRLLLHCGVKWQTPVATRIRGRAPRLVA